MTCPSKAVSIQEKIWRGYAQAATKLGAPCQFYRPSNGPFSSGQSYLGTSSLTQPVSLNAEDMKYGRPNKYGKPTWYALTDGSNVEVGDYFIGQQGTFFIAAMQPLLPILAVECNRTITLYKPQAQSGVGQQGYAGTTKSNERLVVEGVPCSILQGTKGEKSEANLPGDTRSPWWSVLMPASVGVIDPDDILVDDLGLRYVISSNELTDLGYRMTAMTAIT